jgi:hypothetical protein
MKTIKTCMLICIVALSTISGMAQDYYAPGKVINGNGFTYVCKKDIGGILLYNNLNTLTFTEQKNKDGPPIKYEGFEFADKMEPYILDKTIVDKMVNAITSCLTAADKQLVKGESMTLSMYINSDTGVITEINYYFIPYRNAWCRLAPEKFYKIEQALKKDVKFTMTAGGKKLNHNICAIPVKF